MASLKVPASSYILAIAPTKSRNKLTKINYNWKNLSNIALNTLALNEKHWHIF